MILSHPSSLITSRSLFNGTSYEKISLRAIILQQSVKVATGVYIKNRGVEYTLGVLVPNQTVISTNFILNEMDDVVVYLKPKIRFSINFIPIKYRQPSQTISTTMDIFPALKNTRDKILNDALEPKTLNEIFHMRNRKIRKHGNKKQLNGATNNN